MKKYKKKLNKSQSRKKAAAVARKHALEWRKDLWRHRNTPEKPQDDISNWTLQEHFNNREEDTEFEVYLSSDLSVYNEHDEQDSLFFGFNMPLDSVEEFTMELVNEYLEEAATEMLKMASVAVWEAHKTSIRARAESILAGNPVFDYNRPSVSVGINVELRSDREIARIAAVQKKHAVLKDILKRHPDLQPDGTILSTALGDKYSFNVHTFMYMFAEDYLKDKGLDPDAYRTVTLYKGEFVEAYRLPLYVIMERESPDVYGTAVDDFNTFIRIQKIGVKHLV